VEDLMNRKYHRIVISLLVGIFSMIMLIHVSSAMELNVVLSTGQTLKINANPEDTVKKLKDNIFNITEISYLNQAIYVGNKVLKDKNTLASYSIKDGTTLSVRIELQNSPTSKPKSGVLPIVIMIVIILAAGIFFMRKKPPVENRS